MNVDVDLTTDPLTWPAKAGSPTDDAGWDLEWRVLVERMRREPTSAWAQRFRLGELAEPPIEFKRRFLTLVAYLALPTTPGERLVPNGYVVQRLDEELSAERNRQIREALAAGQTRELPTAAAGRAGPGRPAWTDDLFHARWREAIERGKLDPPYTLAKVSGHFESLDGSVGEVDPGYLGRLVRKHKTE